MAAVSSLRETSLLNRRKFLMGWWKRHKQSLQTSLTLQRAGLDRGYVANTLRWHLPHLFYREGCRSEVGRLDRYIAHIEAHGSGMNPATSAPYLAAQRRELEAARWVLKELIPLIDPLPKEGTPTQEETARKLDQIAASVLKNGELSAERKKSYAELALHAAQLVRRTGGIQVIRYPSIPEQILLAPQAGTLKASIGTLVVRTEPFKGAYLMHIELPPGKDGGDDAKRLLEEIAGEKDVPQGRGTWSWAAGGLRGDLEPGSATEAAALRIEIPAINLRAPGEAFQKLTAQFSLDLNPDHGDGFAAG